VENEKSGNKKVCQMRRRIAIETVSACLNRLKKRWKMNGTDKVTEGEVVTSKKGDKAFKKKKSKN
jgi:uncharacterized membrane protein